MPIDKKLEKLIASAGREEARERAAREQWERAERDDEARSKRELEEHRKRAIEPARAIFAWIEGPEGRTLRERMRGAGVEAVAIGPWVHWHTEELIDSPVKGATRVMLGAAEQPDVRVIRCPQTWLPLSWIARDLRRDVSANDARALARKSEGRTLFAAADAIANGTVMQHIERSLRESEKNAKAVAKLLEDETKASRRDDEKSRT